MSGQAAGGAKSTRSLSATRQLRSLLAVVGGLMREGDEVDARTVATRLGLSQEETRDLIDHLLTIGSEDVETGHLPLAISEDGTLRYASPIARAFAGRPLRLIPSEAEALSAAFGEMGLASDDPLRQAVEQAIFPAAPETSALHSGATTPDPFALHSDTAVPSEVAERLDALALAILDNLAIEFEYRPALGAETKAADSPAGSRKDTTKDATPVAPSTPTMRHVHPLALRHERSHWYLDAHDLDRDATRSFRVDRMGEPRTTGITHSGATAPKAEGEADPSRTRTANVVFTDRTLLEVLEWPGLVVNGHGNGSYSCSIPWYTASDWLPRHLAACGASVRIADPELREATARCARELLAETCH